jgi:hypothetical protein
MLASLLAALARHATSLDASRVMLSAKGRQELQQQQQAPTPLQAALRGLPQLGALSLSGYHLPPGPCSPLPGRTSLGVTGGQRAARSAQPRPHPASLLGPLRPLRCRRSRALAGPPARPPARHRAHPF